MPAVKRPARIALKTLWFRYRSEFYESARKGVSFEDFASMKAEEVYGTGDLEEVGCRIIREMVEKLLKYDPSKYGDLPSIIERHWEKSGARRCFESQNS